MYKRQHVFCSFLALVVRKALQDRLEAKGYSFEWADILLDLNALTSLPSLIGNLEISFGLCQFFWNEDNHGAAARLTLFELAHTVCIIIVRFLDEDKDEEAAPQKKHHGEFTERGRLTSFKVRKQK